MRRLRAFQDKDQSSRRESVAIEAVQSCGGRVQKISAADDSREVSFYLVGDKVKDSNLSQLNAIGNVIWLNLANTKITDDGLKHLAGIKLKKLHLEKTAIGDKGLAHLKEQTELEYLNLYATKVTDEGLVHLHGMKNLKRLYVWQSQVTPEGMKQLEEKIPGLEVVGECKLPVIEKKPPKKEEEKKEEKDKDKEKEPAKSEAKPTEGEKKAAKTSDKPVEKPAENKKPEKSNKKDS